MPPLHPDLSRVPARRPLPIPPDRVQLVAEAQKRLDGARGDAAAAKSRLDGAWQSLHATRRSLGIAQAEYQLRQLPEGAEAAHLQAKIAMKQKEFEPVLAGHHERIRAAEAELARKEGEVRKAQSELLRIQGGRPPEARPFTSAPHASLAGRPGEQAAGAGVGNVRATFFDDLVPVAGKPFAMPPRIEHAGQPPLAPRLDLELPES
jgi:hypothetical protein